MQNEQQRRIRMRKWNNVKSPERRISSSSIEESIFLDSLSGPERDYVKNLKRKDRSDLGKIVVSKKKLPVVPLRVKVLQSHLPEPLKNKLFSDLSQSVSDKNMQWILKAIKIPLKVFHPPPPFGLRKAREYMDEVIVGHEMAKKEILKVVQQCILNPEAEPAAYSIGLEGPPGSGKTQFVKQAVAKALNRPIISLPVGGVTDGNTLLWGHNYTYEGSKEGRLVGGMIEHECCNPIVYIDEIDKISSGTHSDLSASLLHLIDPSANTKLRDRYFHDIDIDFSKCVFIFSYNDASQVNPILLNRIKRIPFPRPSTTDMYKILKTIIIPRVQKRIKSNATFTNDAIDMIIEEGNATDNGMRELERIVDHVLTDLELENALREVDVTTITKKEVEKCRKHVCSEKAKSIPLGMYM